MQYVYKDLHHRAHGRKAVLHWEKAKSKWIAIHHDSENYLSLTGYYKSIYFPWTFSFISFNSTFSLLYVSVHVSQIGHSDSRKSASLSVSHAVAHYPNCACPIPLFLSIFKISAGNLGFIRNPGVSMQLAFSCFLSTPWNLANPSSVSVANVLP